MIGGKAIRQQTPSIDDCLFHRCREHLSVAQINSNEFSGAECGACIEAYYEGVLTMVVERLGGTVEGRPTERGNFLQRIDELRRIERDPMSHLNQYKHFVITGDK